MNEIIKKISPQLLLVIFSAVVTYMVTNYKEKSSNQFKHFDRSTIIGYINTEKTELEDRKLQIVFNGKAIKSFSNSRIQIFNYTDKDYVNVPIYVEIIPQEGDSLQISQEKIFGGNEQPDIVKPILNETLNHTVKGSIKYKYNIEVANRADSSNQTVFDASYFIISNKEPKIKVTMQKDGIDFTDFKSEHYFKTRERWWETELAVIMFIVLGFVVYIIALIKIGDHFAAKRTKKFKLYLTKKLEEKITQGKVTLDADTIIKEYKIIDDMFEYEEAWPITRKIKGIKEPTS
jgi:hypothetical protein